MRGYLGRRLSGFFQSS
jgi:hypothetical protein